MSEGEARFANSDPTDLVKLDLLKKTEAPNEAAVCRRWCGVRPTSPAAVTDGCQTRRRQGTVAVVVPSPGTARWIRRNHGRATREQRFGLFLHLRDVEGPQHLADDPAACAAAWLRLQDLNARCPPFVSPSRHHRCS